MFKDARLVTLIPMRKMDRALKFYTKSLGGKMLYRGAGRMKDFWASVRIGKTEIWLVSPSKREKRTVAYSTFVVANIQTVVAELNRKGVKFERAEKGSPESRVEGPITWEPFGASAFFKDTEGNLLMVWQNFPPM